MPYLQSQHFRSSDHLTVQSAPLPRTGEGGQAGDRLTGLLTLEQFCRLGAEQVEACLAASKPCAVAIFDIDHYQRLSHSYSEDVVAHLVRAVAAELEVATQATLHLLARLDEEEFGLLLVGLDGAAATDFCETLRLAIRGIPIACGDLALPITVSVGVADVCGPETFDNYLNGAEQFLFMAKSYGRDQVFSDYTIAMQTAG